MLLKKIVNLGADELPSFVASRVKGNNIAILVSIFLTILYCVNYLFILKEPWVASINSIFIFIYCSSLLLNKYNLHKVSKILFFCTVMLHLIICTNVFVTNKSGFHLYFILIPVGAFALFEYKENLQKFALSFIAILLFFYCENTLNISPLIELTSEMNHFFYQSAFLLNMLAIIFVLSVFANELEVNELKLTKKATTDSVTGIYNRHHFFEQATYNLAIANKLSRPLSIILLDFDNFKKINDTYGHHVGDLSLSETAKQINTHCRSQDCFARLGGDEFIIALSDTTQYEAKLIAKRIQTSIEKNTIKTESYEHLNCQVSVDVCTSSVDGSNSLKDLMMQADKALYQAKEQGGNQVINL